MQMNVAMRSRTRICMNVQRIHTKRTHMIQSKDYARAQAQTQVQAPPHNSAHLPYPCKNVSTCPPAHVLMCKCTWLCICSHGPGHLTLFSLPCCNVYISLHCTRKMIDLRSVLHFSQLCHVTSLWLLLVQRILLEMSPKYHLILSPLPHKAMLHVLQYFALHSS